MQEKNGIWYLLGIEANNVSFGKCDSASECGEGGGMALQTQLTHARILAQLSTTSGAG